jgi:predicted TPR repeat methyltransferase
MFRARIKKDYEKQYKDELVGLVTFVEPPRTDAMYKADNWIYLGETQGMQVKRRGSLDKWVNKEWSTGTKKHIYAKWIVKRKK